jgi:hypothetical protein
VQKLRSAQRAVAILDLWSNGRMCKNYASAQRAVVILDLWFNGRMCKNYAQPKGLLQF